MKKVSYRIPLYLVLLMNVFGFLLLYLNEYNVNMLFLGAGVITLFVAMYVAVVCFKMGDRLLLPIACMLVTIGVLEISEFKLSIGVDQIKFIGVGAAAFFAAYTVFSFFKKWDKLWPLYIVAILGLLFVTYVWGFGQEETGAKLWIRMPGFTLQPSEIIKILYILCIACYYSKSWEKPFMRIQPFVVLAGLTVVMALAYIILNDWGSILIFVAIYMFMMYVYESRRWFFWLCMAGGIVALVMIYFVCVNFPDNSVVSKITKRFVGWLDPWKYRDNEGYQLVMGFKAIASGKYFGVGLGNGGFTPEANFAFETDLIFATICAEMGVFVGAALIIIFFLLAYRCFKITLGSKKPFNRVVALGISFMYSIQTFMIIGGVLGLVPLTGVTVPFVSSGGSSMIVSFGALGIMQAISAEEERTGDSDE